MNWYYQIDGKRLGPVDTGKMRQLVLNETVKADTYVWNEDLPKWIFYGQLTDKMRGDLPAAASSANNPAPAAISPGSSPGQDKPGNSQLCAECKNIFPSSYLAKFGDRYICAGCKNTYVQKMREGISPLGVFNYAGFWIRVAAYIIDAVILGAANLALQFVFSSFTSMPDMSDAMTSNPEMFKQFIMPFMILIIIQITVDIGYPTFFVGKYGATPGKMICGLRIIRPDGSRVSYSRAFARYFAQMLSGIILFIGYLMVAFDDECRALHDRICDTRVIWKER
ncbi:MAG TPA: RDD family protein [Desulfomonilia bacterium]